MYLLYYLNQTMMTDSIRVSPLALDLSHHSQNMDMV